MCHEDRDGGGAFRGSTSLSEPNMEQLEEELTCPICCGLFEDPRVLLCSHSFCRRCLETLLESPRGSAFSRSPFKCPTCRKESPHNGASSLQVNYSLRGIVEKYARLKVTPKTGVCAYHAGQPLNMFCATDLGLICGCCATADEHRGHRFCSLEEAYEREWRALDELLRGVEGWPCPGALARLEKLRAAKKRALQAVNEDAERASDYFDKLAAALESKKSEILCDFETGRLAVMQAFEPEMTRLRDTLDRQSSALAAAEAFRGVTEPLGFLESMHDFRQTLAALKKEATGDATPPAARTPPEVAPLDVKKWDAVRLCDVDKMTVPYERAAAAASSRRYVRRFAPVLLAWGVFLAASTLLLVVPEAVAAAAREHLWEVTGASTRVVGKFIDSAVTYFGGCTLIQ
ncbi:tripartite motif-containing 13 isoform X1 [Phyllopteryx taeniolatus]|uniref:tripartite motif-containing 13 isoform X1 n=2 Tax=Phyllopteryx taeniolatus TaxID=161469 RepID=UPI002AD2EFF8|nr:tripartite motif-containing 13 isoform X1 [Phyllopteryx taeniolatus]